MKEEQIFTVYLDQNVISHMRDGEKEKVKLSGVLTELKCRGAVFVYSNIHVRECRTFYDPIQFVKALDEIDARFLQTSQTDDSRPVLMSGATEELIIKQQDFADQCIGFLSNQTIMMQYLLGWLGELEASELIEELESEIDQWLRELERETCGLIDISGIRGQMRESLHSVDLESLKQENLSQQPQTEEEWNTRFGKLDRLRPEQAVDYIFGLFGDDAKARLGEMFPKDAWRGHDRAEDGSLTGLALLLFSQGIGRDSGVKKKGQASRRKRFLAQFRDCQHIEHAAYCHCFLSNDAGAIKLAEAVYAHAGVSTHVRQLIIKPQ